MRSHVQGTSLAVHGQDSEFSLPMAQVQPLVVELTAHMEKKNHTQGIFFIFWPCYTACGILFPQPEIPALELWSLNHWTTREVPKIHFND